MIIKAVIFRKDGLFTSETLVMKPKKKYNILETITSV